MKSKEIIIVTFFFLLLLVYMSVGYAVYTANVGVSGTVGFGLNGKVKISNVQLTAHNNLSNPTNPTYTDDSINFNLNFTVSSKSDIQNKKYNATYSVTISNDSFYDYAFASSAFTPSIETTNNEDMVVTYNFDGIELNEKIPALTEKTFTITINMYPNNTGNFNVTGEAGVGLEETNDDGSLLATIPKNTTGDLSGENERVKVTATVINSFKTTKSFTFSINNNRFNLYNSNGQALGTYTIDAGQEQSYDIYIYKKDGVIFPTDTQSMNIYFEPVNGNKTSMGVVVLTVDKDETLTDDQPPQVENVAATMLEDVGSVKLDFRVTDNVGIKKITIETYKKNGNSYTKVKTNEINSDAIEYTVTDLEAGTYYFKVYATDTSDNTASSSEISQCSTSEGTCSRSQDIDIKWVFSVTNSLSNARYSGPTSVNYGDTLSAVISGSGNNYSSPTSLTITMGDTTLEAGTNYTYNSNNGELTIPRVTGDISISGSGNYTCLVEGTKIKLANGKTKNIEDINYDDLLLVWNYDTGKLTKEYPLWIEKEKVAKEYIKLTFSDKSTINIVGSHSFYNTDINLFVSTLDEKNFHVGSSIAKINKKGKIEKVKITSIKKINKKVKYYFVGSTAYFNIIANDILTTDGNVLISNRYGFDKNIKWPSKSIKKSMDYIYFKDILPYYLYKGFRAGESAVLFENSNITLDEFKYYIKTEIVNQKMIKEPPKKNGKRYWMVTTSQNNKTLSTKAKVKEGSTYRLPKVDNVKMWYSTSDNKYYKPNETIKVWHGMHFEKIK